MAKTRGDGYDEALKRIKQAGKNGAAELDLSDLGLITLPLEIASLTALQKLDLQGNQLTTLSPEIASLTALQTLGLSYNQLTTLPPEIGSLTALQTLDLKGNKLTTLPPEIGSLTVLQTLELGRNELTTLPQEIGQLAVLKKLSLSHNPLPIAQACIFQLTSLSILWLEGTAISYLPSDIGQLRSLKDLALDNNKLVAIPPEIGRLTALTEMRLDVNQLTTLPPELASLTALQGLELGYNQLTTFPPEIASLTALQTLDLGHNELTALPPEMASLTALRLLSLAGNKLTTLPPAIGSLIALQSLDLDGNQLTTLPPAIGSLIALQSLDLDGNQLTTLPPAIGSLIALQSLDLDGNQLTTLPPAIGSLIALQELHLEGNQLTTLPPAIASLTALQRLDLDNNQLTTLPPAIASLTALQRLDLDNNQLTTLPPAIASLTALEALNLNGNPLEPQLAAAYKSSTADVLRYLAALKQSNAPLDEAKLILVGEGEVGKTSLLAALCGDEWVEDRPTTHGIEIKSFTLNTTSGSSIRVNGWDFGGQKVYKPTHQFFFTAPAIYLAVWRPREGLDQNLVKEWIRLVLRRQPEAKILIVATHGGAKDRQADIVRQDFFDEFGTDTIQGFFHVDSRPPDEDPASLKRYGECLHILELKKEIARLADKLPGTHERVPTKWNEARKALKKTGSTYMPVSEVRAIATKCGVADQDAISMLQVCRRVGDLMYYDRLGLKEDDIVILRADWLTQAISYVLDDSGTREKGGLVRFERLSHIWSGGNQEKQEYPRQLHPVFLKLMEDYDLSYRVALGTDLPIEKSMSLIGQLVDDLRPGAPQGWEDVLQKGDVEQVEVCRILDDEKNTPATAEGLFYQLIVRLHKYSLGAEDFAKAKHWQRGLWLRDSLGAKAHLEQIGAAVRITVRSPYPTRFLSALTYEVEWLTRSQWKGLRCVAAVPCLQPTKPCEDVFEVRDLLDSKSRGQTEERCNTCKQWQKIDTLLDRSAAVRPDPIAELAGNVVEIKVLLDGFYCESHFQQAEVRRRFDQTDAGLQAVISKVEDAYARMIWSTLDEARNGPRLFTIEPMAVGFLDRPAWVAEKFRLTLWCEHSRLPLPALNPPGDKSGVYEHSFDRKWVRVAAPWVKRVGFLLELLLPVVGTATKVLLSKDRYESIGTRVELSGKVAESALKGANKLGEWVSEGEAGPTDTAAKPKEAEGGALKFFHSWLIERDPGFGGLVPVRNRREEILWVHKSFAGLYRPR